MFQRTGSKQRTRTFGNIDLLPQHPDRWNSMARCGTCTRLLLQREHGGTSHPRSVGGAITARCRAFRIPPQSRAKGTTRWLDQSTSRISRQDLIGNVHARASRDGSRDALMARRPRDCRPALVRQARPWLSAETKRAFQCCGCTADPGTTTRHQSRSR